MRHNIIKNGFIGDIMRKVCSVVLSALLCLMLVSCSTDGQAIVFFPECDGEAVLVMSPESVVLVNSGGAGDGERIEECLSRFDIGKIDLMILTSGEAKNMGGAEYLLKHIDIGAVCEAPSVQTSGASSGYEKIINALDILPYVVTGDLSFENDGIKYDIYTGSDGEESALTVCASSCGTRAILSADITAEHYLSLYGAGYDLDCALARLPSDDPSLFSAYIRTSDDGYIIVDNPQTEAQLSELVKPGRVISAEQPLYFLLDGTGVRKIERK